MVIKTQNYPGEGYVSVRRLNWYIKASTGDDTKDGSSAGNAVQTIDRMLQLWNGSKAFWDQGVYNVYVLEDLALLRIPGFIRTNSTIWVHGSATAGQGQSILLASSVVASRVIQDPTTPTGGTRGSLTVTGLNWTTGGPGSTSLISTAASPNKRIRITDTGLAGTVMWPQKDEGTGKVDHSRTFASTSSTLGSAIVSANTTPAYANLAGSEHIVVEKLTTITSLVVDAEVENDYSVSTSGFAVGMDSLNFLVRRTNRNTPIFYFGCSGLTSLSDWSERTRTLACQLAGGGASSGSIVEHIGYHATGNMAGNAGGRLVLDGQGMTQSSSAGAFSSNRGAYIQCANIGVFDSSSQACLLRDGYVSNENIFYAFGPLWGTGNTLDCLMQEGARGLLTTPNMAGTTQIQVGSQNPTPLTRTWAQGSVIETQRDINVTIITGTTIVIANPDPCGLHSKFAFDFNTANNAVHTTVPTGERWRVTGLIWEITGNFTGGTNSAIGVSSSNASYSTAGDLLGGATGDVSATLVASNVFAGTLTGTKIVSSMGNVFLVAGDTIKHNRITSAFTAGTGFLHVFYDRVF